jgi:hypothetical protein
MDFPSDGEELEWHDFEAEEEKEEEIDPPYDPQDADFNPAEPDKGAVKEPKAKRRRKEVPPKTKPVKSVVKEPKPKTVPVTQAAIDEVFQSGAIDKIKKEFECCTCKEILCDTRQCGNASSSSSSSSSSSTAPRKGHNVCGICWHKLLAMPTTRNKRPQCPLCRCAEEWTSNASLDNVIEIMYPTEVKARKDASWSTLPWNPLCIEIVRRLDPQFQVKSNFGDNSTHLTAIVEIAREMQQNRARPAPTDAELTDKLYKAVQPAILPNRRHPSRYFYCSVSPIGNHRMDNQLSFNVFGFGSNDALIVRLLDRYWFIIEAPRILVE